MRTAKEAAEHTMRLAELHLAQQEERIERQKKLIASLEADGHTEVAQAARQLLMDMFVLLANMDDDRAEAEARWMAQRVANATEQPPKSVRPDELSNGGFQGAI
jgi:cytochrome P450